MNSMLTILDTDEEEVIDLDVSQDAIRDASCSGKGNNAVYNKENQALEEASYTQDSGFTNETPITQNSQAEQCECDDPKQPLFKVMFRDENTLRQYRERIKHFFQNLGSFKSKCADNADSSLILEIWTDEESSESKHKDDIPESEDSQDKHMDINVASDDSQDILCEMFTIDTKPKLTDSLDIPTYGKKYSEVCEKSNTKTETKPDRSVAAPRMSCFNCMGNHNLRDCPKPKNQANINKNRKEFTPKGNAKAVRYHLDDDQRFGHMLPGQLSKNLRRALGLKENQLPQHIYRMRMLGYPPGWLEEARLQHSGISLFNSDGRTEPDANEEPGEIIVDGDKDQYDIKKIFDFPGFNVPALPGAHDDYKPYWAPDQQYIQSKEIMLLNLSSRKADDGYKRKKLKLFQSTISTNASTVPSEMEVEDVDECVMESVSVNGFFIPPLPKELPNRPPDPPPITKIRSDDANMHSQESHFADSTDDRLSPTSRTDSPSLYELESMKSQLLVELEDSSSQSNLETPVKNSVKNSKTEMLPPGSTGSTPQTGTSNSTQTTPNSSRGTVKSLDFGTPILQSTSPYNKLPSSEKFSKNICDVINFENLPDSTGKYEQMTEVLQKVRSTLAQIHKE